MTEKLWDLANLVTGFAVAHSIATTFAMAKGELRVSLKGAAAHWMAAGATLIFTTFYLVAIVWCHIQGMPTEEKKVDIWRTATVGRIGAVVLFTALTLGTVYGHRRDELREGKPVEPEHPKA